MTDREARHPWHDAEPEDEDLALVAAATGGDRQALQGLVERHQRWIYNVALRMACDPDGAQDVTQEVLIKVITRLASFRGQCRFRTWLYRIVANHVVDMRRRVKEWPELTFSEFRTCLDRTPDRDLPDPDAVPADIALVVEEAKLLCTTGMLLCLERRQRLAFILGAVFGVADTVAAELMEISRANFRQILARARRDLRRFMDGHCGLLRSSNPCRCERKTRAFIEAGAVDPARLHFAQAHIARIRTLIQPCESALEDAVDAQIQDLFRDGRPVDLPDRVALLRAVLDHEDVRVFMRL